MSHARDRLQARGTKRWSELGGEVIEEGAGEGFYVGVEALCFGQVTAKPTEYLFFDSGHDFFEGRSARAAGDERAGNQEGAATFEQPRVVQQDAFERLGHLTP